MTSLLRKLNPLRWSLSALAVIGLLLAPSLSGGAPVSSAGLQPYYDGSDPSTPLDLSGVTFGQTASTDLTLIIRTNAPWESSIVNPRFGRSLCVILRNDAQKHASGRLCAYPSHSAKSGLGLRYTVFDPATGRQRGIRDLSTVVSRPDKQTFRVTLTPALLRLKPDVYHWRARSQYRDDAACPPPNGCQDLLPDAGEAAMNVSVSVAPAARRRCFGAASRDVRRPCRNPKLARAVVPTPDQAEVSPNLPCTPLKTNGLVIPCEFGVPAAQATNTVALLGDSHAAHWRAALEYVATEVKWRGVSITRSGCPLSRATARLQPKSRRAQCTRWNREVPDWLAAHPQVSTVFVVAHYDAGVVATPGKDEWLAKIGGYAAAWRALPKTVKRVIVIRDTPKSTIDTLNCVRAAITKRKSAANACAMPRPAALGPDPAAAAAARVASQRVLSIDMSSFFCSNARCFPVVGGALVYKDISHLTDVFSSTLGPYLLRKIRALNGYRP
ncbi:MAG TPA: SGNH hydrolase domain-containing protein [Solirubrobacteraceae bacterium]|nr:SGNH hydrolase domain-containing protein [Solirubrobacteraceae bacterium]